MVLWFGSCALGSWVISANMHCKLFVTLQFEVAHHLIERRAGEGTTRFEPPVAFGATKTPKMLLLNPHHLPAHGRLCRRAQRRLTACLVPRLPSGDETFSFHSRVLPDAAENRHPVRAWRRIRKEDAVYLRQFGLSVGHPTYMEVFFRIPFTSGSRLK
jgi:hypothetical protein